MIKVLPGFATLSEFIAGFNGDCGGLMLLCLLHEVDPVRWPLTPAALKALVDDLISLGLAGSNGAMDITQVDRYLTHLQIAHHTIGYNQFNLQTFHNDIKALSGVKPWGVEWALAGKLPGDEPNVHFHYSGGGGIDTGPKGDGVGGAYLFADGDNRANDPHGQPRAPVRYTWADIVAAQPIAYVVIDEPLAKPPASVVWLFNADGTAIDTQHHTVGQGVAYRIRQDGKLAVPAYDSERNAPAGAAPVTRYAALTDGTTYTWDGHTVGTDGARVANALQRVVDATPPPAPAQTDKQRAAAAVTELGQYVAAH